MASLPGLTGKLALPWPPIALQYDFSGTTITFSLVPDSPCGPWGPWEPRPPELTDRQPANTEIIVAANNIFSVFISVSFLKIFVVVFGGRKRRSQ
jgi:hypothetical protein